MVNVLKKAPERQDTQKVGGTRGGKSVGDCSGEWGCGDCLRPKYVRKSRLCSGLSWFWRELAAPGKVDA